MAIRGRIQGVWERFRLPSLSTRRCATGWCIILQSRFIEREHVNRADEILDVLDGYFHRLDRTFFPFRIPAQFCNLVIGLTLRPRQTPRSSLAWRAGGVSPRMLCFSSGNSRSRLAKPALVPRLIVRIGVNLYPLALRGGDAPVCAPVTPLADTAVAAPLRPVPRRPRSALAGDYLAPTFHDRAGPMSSVPIQHQDEIFGHADRFDLYFCPLNCLAPDLLDRPTVATLADVQEQFFPHYFTAEQLALRGLLYPRMVRAATRLITISEFSKRSICQAFGVAPDKVRVTHLTANEEMQRARPEWPASLPVLPGASCCTRPTSTRTRTMSCCCGRCVCSTTSLGLDCACVMTGHETSPGIPLRELIEACGLTGKALWLGHVAPGALRHLYERAAALCFPSQFEGFGLPLIEAMTNGCPVIATAAASIPEVVGDAALLVEPTAPALAGALARVLGEPALREQLVGRGRQRARLFNPRRLARQTLRILREAARRFTPAASVRRPAAAGVTFVVRPSAGGPALSRTLASLSFEVHDHDQVLVLAEAERLDSQSLSLLDNLPGGRLVATAWLDEAGHDVLCYLREGECLCEGATRAALAALTESPSCARRGR